ncbi:autorepressor SdpR family transcription factor [Streptococcus mutans]|uniref:autorepressor SdpR family transcription factor n=1 Tax=Streptococcus mutans TaxID=1309 RepID=UPI0014557980|nr:autorepressor SdpR family transcription factor [Streptococcus mutans]NLQ74756.1 ArsR family transcriptional regulator [Streptococcus mutans]
MGFAETFKALSNPIRRDILDLLKLGQLSAGEISSHFELAGATISHHLSVLKRADLVRETRGKNFIYYELNTSVLEDMMVWLADLKGNTHDED